MKKTVLTFSGIIIALIGLFQISKYSISSGDLKIEFVIAGIALIFLLIGLFISKKRNQSVIEEDAPINFQKIEELGISKREYEILQKISEGLSNKEIGQALFVSEHTVKTHASNLFQKLNVKRRTQAIQKAKSLNILP